MGKIDVHLTRYLQIICTKRLLELFAQKLIEIATVIRFVICVALLNALFIYFCSNEINPFKIKHKKTK